MAHLPRVLVCVPCSPRGESSSLPGPAPTCLAGGPGTCVLPFIKGWIVSYKGVHRPCVPFSECPRGLCGHVTAVCALGWGTRRSYQGSVLEDGTRHPTHEGEAPENQLGSPGDSWLDPTQCRRPHSSGAAVHSGGSQSTTNRAPEQQVCFSSFWKLDVQSRGQSGRAPGRAHVPMLHRG